MQKVCALMNLSSNARNFAENRCKLQAAGLSGLAAFFNGRRSTNHF